MAYNPQNPNGQATAANSSPVVLASDQSAVPITDNSGSITVDGIVTVTQSTASNLKVDLSGTSANATAIKVDGSAVTQPVSGTITANAGTGSFTVAQGTAANLNATVVGTGTFAVQADTELPAATALADAVSNYTTTTAGAASIAFNGTSWDRVKTSDAVAGTGANDTVVGILAASTGPGYSIRYNPTALATATNSTSAINVEGANTMVWGISTTTTGTFIFEGTADNTNWYSIEVFDASADLWVTNTSLTPTLGKAYYVACSGLRQIRIRVTATLGATVSHFVTLTNGGQVLSAIDTGFAPHNFGDVLVHKDAEYTTAQTGTVIWTPTTGKKFAISDLTISVGGTTSGIVTIFDAVTATTTYTAGTTPAIFRGTFAPSTTANPGVAKSFNIPYVSAAANNVVHVTTSAAMTVYIQLNGYEI